MGSCRDSASCTEALSAACTTTPFLEGSTCSRAKTCKGMGHFSGQPQFVLSDLRTTAKLQLLHGQQSSV